MVRNQIESLSQTRFLVTNIVDAKYGYKTIFFIITDSYIEKDL